MSDYPAIPIPKAGSESLLAATNALKQSVELLTGQRGSRALKAWTKGEARELIRELPYDLKVHSPASPTAAQILVAEHVVRRTLLPSDLAGSFFSCDMPPESTYAIRLTLNGYYAPQTVATSTFLAGATKASLVTTLGIDWEFLPGDVLRVIAPADVSLNIAQLFGTFKMRWLVL